MNFIYKKTEQDEIEFIEFVDKANTSYWQRKKINEHEIINQLINNPNLNHRNNLLFYHWYERRYNVNVINTDVLKSINKVINVTKKELHNDVRDKMLEYMNSTRFLGFTIYYEYYFDFFPQIEKFNFNEFIGKSFVEYLMKLFPTCSEIDYLSKKRFFRFSDMERTKLETNGWLVLYYKSNKLPSFYPHKINSLEYYTYNPHVFLQKNRREIENIVREEKSIPKIGEGWISETLLYYQIKEAFPNHLVIHHGSPSWLGAQHLDIYFPKLKIGVEYQGKQHSEPVNFFGGEKAYIKNQERDQRKIRLCKKNGVKLLFVFPETDSSMFLKDLKSIIEKE